MRNIIYVIVDLETRHCIVVDAVRYFFVYWLMADPKTN
jgi:hypothetical protein